MLFAITYWSGLRRVVLEDVRERAGPVKVLRTLVGKRHDAAIVAYEGEPAELLALRSVEGVFALAGDFQGVRVSGTKGLQRIADVCEKARFDRALSAVGAAWELPASRGLSFALTINVVGHHNFSQRDVRRILLDQLQGRLGWVHSPSDWQVNVRLQLIRDKGFLGLALADRQMRKRPYKVATRPGSLHPPVAYCLARLTQPGPTDVFMDPMCGAGTIAIERALGWPSGKVICGDLLGAAVDATVRNARAAAVDLDVCRWDATRLPLPDAGVDAAAINMPYGKDTPLREPEQFLTSVLAETGRVLRRGGRLAVISAHGRLIQRWLARHSLFQCEKPLRVPLHGFDATILALRRS